MRRGTTPTIVYHLPAEANGIVKDIRLTFEQDGETVIEKTLADCTLDGVDLTVSLSQEETLKFNALSVIKMQMKILTFDGKIIPSKEKFVFCRDILNEEILS